MAAWSEEELVRLRELKQFVKPASRDDYEFIADKMSREFGVVRTGNSVRAKCLRMDDANDAEDTADERGGSTPAKPLEADGLGLGLMENRFIYHPMTGGKVVVLGDFHIPFHNPYAIAIALEITKRIDPDLIIINGDFIDNYSVKWFTDAEVPKDYTYQKEWDIANRYFQILRKRHPEADIIYNPANHEARLMRYLAEKARELQGLDCLKLENLLHLDRYNIRLNGIVNKESRVDLGKILVGHWTKYSKHAGYTAKNLIEEKGISLVQNHTHKIGSHYRTWVRRQVAGYENGCLCTLTPEYKPDANWQLGFCCITFVHGYFSVQQIPIVSTEEGELWAIYGGEIYSRRVEHEYQL